MTYPTQVDRHDLLEIHDVSGTEIGRIVPGTIVPIRFRTCYWLRRRALLLSSMSWRFRPCSHGANDILRTVVFL